MIKRKCVVEGFILLDMLGLGVLEGDVSTEILFRV